MNDKTTPPPRVICIDSDRKAREDFTKILSAGHREPDLNKMEAKLFGGPFNKAPSGYPCRVEHSPMGKEGVEMAATAVSKGDPFAVAFVDFSLAGELNGPETALALLGLDPHIQVVVSTAYSHLAWGEFAESLGENRNLAILKKPFGRDEVTHLAASLVSRRKRMGDLEKRVAELEKELARKKRELGVAEETVRRAAVNPVVYRIRIGMDPEGRIRSWSPDAERLFGWSEGEILGREVSILLGAACAGFWKEDVLPLLKERGGLESDFKMRKKSGELFPAWIFLSTRYLNSGAVSSCTLYLAPGQTRGTSPGLYLVNARLETEAREFKAALEESRKRVLSAGSLDNEVVGRMIHKFRSPVNALTSSVEMVLHDLPAEILEKKELHYKKVRKNMARLTRVADNFMYLVTADMGRMRLNPVPLDMNKRVPAIAREFRKMEIFENLELIVRNPGVPTLANADSVRIFEAFRHILENAAKYSEPGGKVVIGFGEDEIETDTCMAPALRIDITDWGRGIPLGEEERIFRRFYPVGDDLYRKESGLGLTICRMILERQGGRIWAGNNPEGKGARISMAIPRYSVETFEGSLQYKAVLPEPRPPADESAMNIL